MTAPGLHLREILALEATLEAGIVVVFEVVMHCRGGLPSICRCGIEFLKSSRPCREQSVFPTTKFPATIPTTIPTTKFLGKADETAIFVFEEYPHDSDEIPNFRACFRSAIPLVGFGVEVFAPLQSLFPRHPLFLRPPVRPLALPPTLPPAFTTQAISLVQ
jgi:hypothetical protein